METSVLEALLEELVDIALHENEEHDERQDIFDVQAQPLREHEALAGVRFGDEIVPSPSVLSGTKQKVTKTSKRKKVIRNNKIFQIHDVASISEWLESGKYIESKYTWNA